VAQSDSDVETFLGEAVRRGLCNAAQAEECRRIASTVADVGVALTIDEIAQRKGLVTAEQAAEIRRSLTRLRIGRYEVIDRLGEGAAGVVWKARDTKLDRIVALKVLSQRAQAVPDFKERFLREARIAVTLNHVNIVRGLDYGESDGYQFFAMELVEGDDAEKRLARLGRIAEKDAVAMALDVIRALAYVQKFKIVHRDIKPGNLLLTPTGHVKLCDLGLAKPMLTESQLTGGDGTTAGTPLYMSPEQIREPDRVDWRSDVYSLGATLYHLLTGVPLFRPDRSGGILHKHVHESPVNPRERVLELSDSVASVVLRMLQKNPDERYASLDDLTSDLESVLTGRTPLHTTPPVPPQEMTAERHARLAIAKRITEKNLPREAFPWSYAIVLALAAAIGVLGFVGFHGGTKSVPPTTPAGPPAASPPAAPPDKEPAAAPTSPPPQPIATAPNASPEDSEVERRAEETLNKRLALAQQQAAEGHFVKAHEALLPFPAEFAKTRAARQAQRHADDFDTTAAGRFDELVRRAKDFARRRHYDESRDLVDAAERVEWSWAADRAKLARNEVETIVADTERRRDEQKPRYTQLYGNVILEAGQDLAAARAMLERDGRELDTFRDELDELRGDLRVLERYGTNAQVLDHDTAQGAFASLLARLSQGDVVGARDELDALRKHDTERDGAGRVARVEAVLAARADEILVRAEARRAAGDLDAAAREAEEARSVFPSSARPRILLGRIRLEQHRLDAAREVLEPAIAVRSAPAEAHLRLGQVLAAQGEDLARAETELRQFVEAANVGDALRPEGEAALRDVHRRRVEADLKRWRTLASKAHGAAREGAWGRVLELDPDDPEALLRLGFIYHDVNPSRPQQAYPLLAHFLELKDIDPAQRNRAAGVVQQLKARGYTPADGSVTALAGDHAFEAELWDEAVSHYRNALVVSPHLVTARARLVRALLARARETKSQDDARAAAETAMSLVKLLPDGRDVAEPLGLCAEAELMLGQTKQALADAVSARAADPGNAAANLALGHAYLAEDEPAKAADAFLVANRIEASPPALLGLATCHLARGRVTDAAAVLDVYRDRWGDLRTWRDEFRELSARVVAATDEPPK
jgi:eukaryotic-like serine/threonine-protein kinase